MDTTKSEIPAAFIRKSSDAASGKIVRNKKKFTAAEVIEELVADSENEHEYIVDDDGHFSDSDSEPGSDRNNAYEIEERSPGGGGGTGNTDATDDATPTVSEYAVAVGVGPSTPSTSSPIAHLGIGLGPGLRTHQPQVRYCSCQ